jgi:hypothetical protein
MLRRTILLVAISAASTTMAADLKPETIAAWDEYVKNLDCRAPRSFASENPSDAARLRAGEIIVEPASDKMPLRVPYGLIHDWRGESFLRGATIEEVVRVLRDYDRYKDFYRPYVLESRLISRDPLEDRFSALIMNKSVIAKTALRTTYRSVLHAIEPRHLYIVTDSIHIQEVAALGTPSEHLLPEDEGTGLIWRLHSLTRLEQRDGGVYFDLEVVAMSRDIPASLRWLVSPIVRRVSRSSLAASLRQTGDAVRGDALIQAASASSTPRARLVR